MKEKSKSKEKNSLVHKKQKDFLKSEQSPSPKNNNNYKNNPKNEKTSLNLKMRSIKDIDSNLLNHNYSSTQKLLSTANTNFYSRTTENFDHPLKIASLTLFKGFHNKNFNLTSYKKSRDDSRERSKSPERIYLPHKLKGNGIPENLYERIKFLGGIFSEKKFRTFYEERPDRKHANFEEIIEYIVSYRKNHSELEAAMMAYYFVCHEIKFGKVTYVEGKKIKENSKISSKPSFVFKYQKANSIGFTNIFELLLKRKKIKIK